MKTRHLLNLVLVCVVAALALVAAFEPGKEQPESKPLTHIDDSGLQSFSLQSHETIQFERRNGHWWLKSPLAAPANDIRVRQLLDITKSDIDAQYPLHAEELTKYELDKPTATLVIGDQTIVFGGSDPIDMRRYVQIGDTLYLVRDDFSHHLNAGATDYVDKKLLPEDARISSIAVPGIKVTLNTEGKWIATPAAADTAAAAALAGAWQSARAIDVKRMDKPAQGDKVRVELTDGSSAEFVIVQREPELVLGRSELGIQYELVGEIAKQLLNQPVPDDDKPAAVPEDEHHPSEASPEEELDDSHGESEHEITDPDGGEEDQE